MFSFRLETEINKPLEQVIRLFEDREQMARWQPGLISMECIEKDPHPKYNLTFQIGRRKMILTETILRNELPSHFEVSYTLKGVVNRAHHSFKGEGSHNTKWISITTYQFKGLMKLVAIFMKGDFYKQSAIIMSNFKGFAESRI